MAATERAAPHGGRVDPTSSTSTSGQPLVPHAYWSYETALTAVHSAATEHARENRVFSRLVVSRGWRKLRCNSLEQFSQFRSDQSVGSQIINSRLRAETY